MLFVLKKEQEISVFCIDKKSFNNQQIETKQINKNYIY